MAIWGIAARSTGRPVDNSELQAMGSALALSAGESMSCCASASAGLGAASALNTSSLFCSAQATVACDADLLNRRELADLARAAAPAATDASLIAALYAQYGPEFLSRLRGVFSLAIWDKKTQSLLLAVDRMGVKPLCYSSNGEIVFASHARGIFAGGRVNKHVDEYSIVEYVNYNMIPAPRSAFHNVRKLAPGTCLRWSVGGVEITRYWDMRYPEDASGSVDRLAEELLANMEQAVRASAVDLEQQKSGCYLSGGTDSSSVVGLLTQIQGAPVNTFSIGFSEGRFNELEYAHLAVSHFGARQHEATMTPDDAIATIPRIVDAYDEPFGNSSAIPTFWCAKLGRESGMDVMLAGDGGDEIFGGNERYRTHEIFELYQKIPGAFRRGLIEPLLFATPEVSWLGKGQRYIKRSNLPNPERYCQWRLLQVFSPDRVFDPSLPRPNGHGDLLAAMRAHYKSAPAKSELNRLLYIDLKMTLGDDDLPKVVRTAEMAGIKVRFPYLDHELVEFTGRVPASLKVRRLNKRYLFKRATRGLLPEAILQKKKHGFGVPVGFWLKTNPKLRQWARDVFSDPRTYQRGYFQRQFVDEIYTRMDQDDSPYYGDLLWPFFVLELWHRRHVDGGGK